MGVANSDDCRERPPRSNSDPVSLINRIHHQQEQQQQTVPLDNTDGVAVNNRKQHHPLDNDGGVATDVVIVESSEEEDAEEVSMEPAVKRTKSSDDRVITDANCVSVTDDLQDFDDIISTFCEE